MQLLKCGNFRNIKLNQEYADLKTSDGKNFRLIVDLDKNSVRLIVDHSIRGKQLKDFTPYIELEHFYND